MEIRYSNQYSPENIEPGKAVKIIEKMKRDFCNSVKSRFPVEYGFSIKEISNENSTKYTLRRFDYNIDLTFSSGENKRYIDGKAKNYYSGSVSAESSIDSIVSVEKFSKKITRALEVVGIILFGFLIKWFLEYIFDSFGFVIIDPYLMALFVLGGGYIGKKFGDKVGIIFKSILVNRAFNNEQVQTSYGLWEKFEEDMNHLFSKAKEENGGIRKQIIREDFSRVEQIYNRLIGLAVDRRSVAGCTDQQIEDLEKEHKVVLPESYKNFLKLLGKKSGKIFPKTDISFDKISEIRDLAKKTLNESAQELVLQKNCFLFSMKKGYNGYQFLFFNTNGSDESEIYRIADSESEPTKISENFTQFFQKIANRLLDEESVKSKNTYSCIERRLIRTL